MRVALLLLAALAAPALGAPADVSHTWYLTGERGDIEPHGLAGVLLMAPQMAGTQSTATFSSAPVPGLPGAPSTVESVTWYWDGAWPLDMEIRQDVTVALFVQASVQATADVRIDLQAVDAGGGSVTVGQADEALVGGGAEPQERSFTLPARGQVLPAGSTLALTVRLDGASLATVLLYDADETPSRVEGLTVAPLDTDGDGVPDSSERLIGSDPLNPREPGDGGHDTDGDGVPDEQELTLGTDPLNPDSDGDGWGDGSERTAGTDPLNGADRPTDSDGDGLFDSFERRAGTRVDAGDTDADGISDCHEDPDEDNLTHCQEQAWGSDPQEPDTDGDGVDDGQEVARHTDPTVAARVPALPGPQVAEIVVAGVFLAAGIVLSLVGLGRRHRL